MQIPDFNERKTKFICWLVRGSQFGEPYRYGRVSFNPKDGIVKWGKYRFFVDVRYPILRIRHKRIYEYDIDQGQNVPGQVKAAENGQLSIVTTTLPISKELLSKTLYGWLGQQISMLGGPSIMIQSIIFAIFGLLAGVGLGWILATQFGG